MDSQSVLTDFDKATTGLFHQLEEFTPEQMHQVPPDGGWSAAQIAKHLLKAGEGIPQIFQGETVPTTRPPDANVGVIRKILLDYTSKMQSPEFILPGNVTDPKEDLLKKLRSAMAEIQKVSATLDLSVTCASFELPNLGQLTRLEWMVFVTCHTQRHTRQMGNLLQKINQIS